MKINFNIGDQVVALSNGECPSQPRNKGDIYTITNIFYCSTEGKQLVNINNTKSCSKTGYISCGCGKKHRKDDHFAYTYSTEFALLENLSDYVEAAIEEENYETADLLHKIMNEKYN